MILFFLLFGTPDSDLFRNGFCVAFKTQRPHPPAGILQRCSPRAALKTPNATTAPGSLWWLCSSAFASVCSFWSRPRNPRCLFSTEPYRLYRFIFKYVSSAQQRSSAVFAKRFLVVQSAAAVLNRDILLQWGSSWLITLRPFKAL